MADEHDIALADERRRAVRALLNSPLLHPGHDEFPLVRRHADWLKSWFGQFLGYRLVVEAGFARLFKAGLPVGQGRPLLRPTGPFTPRSYTYLALTTAVLYAGPEQLLLSQLVADIRSAAVEAGIDLGDVDRPVERRALTAALRQLVRWRVLLEEQGTVDGDQAEALLSVDRDLVTHLLAAPIGRAGTAEEFIAAASAAGPGGARHTVRRRLVECPVLYVDDLTAKERAWLRKEQRRDERSFADYTGLHAELRAEGAALLDPDDELSDVDFPGTGTVPHAALLTIEALTGALAPVVSRTGPPVVGVPVPEGLIERILAGLVQRHAKRWAAAYTENLTTLQDAVVDLLTQLGLLGRAGPTVADAEADEEVTAERAVDARAARGSAPDGTLVLLAAAARYAVLERTGKESG
ncbi:TIGR02678 family protein [Dactylosporangium sp. NBC_01737]|uniref:TIGR02678 family protein n=1 Tax=Dactylosporangium sp. NBC_01737 TaxID=2975959 RepID=UPI002E15046E|nr:TIGR02678 family protein [Dactylosporangium sp. NBC_01737]